jgi:glucose dehydrogenase
MINGTLYTSTSLSQVAAIDAVTGETKWTFDPQIYKNGLGIPASNGWLHRGVAKRSGIISSSITACGITICQLRPT